MEVPDPSSSGVPYGSLGWVPLAGYKQGVWARRDFSWPAGGGPRRCSGMGVRADLQPGWRWLCRAPPRLHRDLAVGVTLTLTSRGQHSTPERSRWLV